MAQPHEPGLQRRYGLYISSAASLFDAVEAEGTVVAVAERLGDVLANAAHHSDAHKWLVANWKQMEAAAAPDAVVRQGDKGVGLMHSPEYCNSYVGDVLIQNDDDREIIEIRNYTTFVSSSTGCPAVCTLNGGLYASGNTEERLKYKVFGSRKRGMPALGAYNHADGTGFVPAKKGDYHDCLDNRKARLHLIIFEAGLGGLNAYGARRLRRKGREAKANGADPTDYSLSPTARSFVPYYAQRLSTTSVMYGARAVQKSLKGMAATRRSAAMAA